MMQDKDLTDDVLDEIIAGAKTSMEQYLALSLKAERVANRQLNSQQNIPEIIPATQFKPVADLYEMQFDDGRTCAFHTDGAKAVQWLLTCDGNKVQEYVKLDRYQEALSGNSPVTPDDVRRMDWLVSKTVNVREPMVYGSHSLFWSQTITDEEDDYHATKLREQIDEAMAAERAAAPQQ